MDRFKNKKGISLLEIICATMLMAFVITIVGQLFVLQKISIDRAQLIQERKQEAYHLLTHFERTISSSTWITARGVDVELDNDGSTLEIVTNVIVLSSHTREISAYLYFIDTGTNEYAVYYAENLTEDEIEDIFGDGVGGPMIRTDTINNMIADVNNTIINSWGIARLELLAEGVLGVAETPTIIRDFRCII